MKQLGMFEQERPASTPEPTAPAAPAAPAAREPAPRRPRSKLECTRTALFSDCGVYRYRLSRTWGPGPRALGVLLNPSKADAEHDDATVLTFMRFVRSWKCGGFDIVNAYAFCATDPKDLWRQRWDLRVGPDNDKHIAAALTECQGPLVLGWGRMQPPSSQRELVRARVLQVLELLEKSGRAPMCLGTNEDGSPKHPLYLPNDTCLELFERTQPYGRRLDDDDD